MTREEYLHPFLRIGFDYRCHGAGVIRHRCLNKCFHFILLKTTHSQRSQVKVQFIGKFVFKVMVKVGVQIW